jgi:hypothetical protein
METGLLFFENLENAVFKEIIVGFRGGGQLKLGDCLRNKHE